MRIKKLELVGFKSFKDRTVIHFDAGITGIVGPNGCGKSNIVDALVWVMGEMSAKHLRGSSMEDVIFAGAEGYAPAGLSEVSLTLENDGGPFPAKYIRHSEIMVTRRLHRSGESEYLVNKEPARLRDVQEIFMDTGAGAKGFSIIQQGMIGQLITAKPLDRRMLIEEAAGITKFKVRKRESQRKLEATEQNLVRLHDITGELRRQIDSLQRQAQRAERYRNLKQQIEDLDLWVSSSQYEGLKKSSDEAEMTFNSAQSQEVEGETEVASLQTQVEQEKLELLEREKILDGLQQAQFDFQTSIQKRELEIQELKFEIEQAKRNEQMTGSLAQESQARMVLLEKELSNLQERHAIVQQQTIDFKQSFEEKNEIFQTSSARISEADEELTTKRRELFAVGQLESSLDARVQSLQTQVEEIRERETTQNEIAAELKSKQGEFETRRNKIFSELEKDRQLSLDMANDAESFEANKKILTQNLAEKRSEVETFKDHLNEVTSRLYGLENLQSNFEGFEEGVKNVMFWQKSRPEMTIDGSVTFQPVAEVVEVPNEYEVAMEAALGSRLQMLLAPNSTAPVEAVSYLKEQNSGRSSFFSEDMSGRSVDFGAAPSGDGVRAILKDVVTSPDKFQNSVSYLLSGVAVVDSIRKALELRPQHPGWTFVTADGDTLSADGVLTGGATDSADSGVLKRKREIKELSLQKSEWSGKLALAQEIMKKIEKQLENVTQDFEGAQKRKVEQEIKVATLKKDLERAEQEVVNAGHAVERQEREIAKIREQLLSQESRCAELEASLHEAREKKYTLEVESESLTTELANIRMGFDSLQSDVTDLQVRSATKAQELEGLERQLQIVQKSVNEVQEQLSRMTEESSKNSVSMSENQMKFEESKVALERELREVQETKSQLATAKNEYEVLSSGVRTREERLNQVTRARNELQSKMNEAQLKLEQARMKTQYLIDQIRERYMLELPDVVARYEGRQGDLSQAETELKELREKISKIGDVNLSAIEEYEDTAKRYEFLSQQQNDLIEAKEQLRKVIDRINRICSKRFKETFDLVNDKFTRVFPVLFGGGEARLELHEDVDKGEMGIEIVAKPPGKKMQNVTLMSGGEKALTAVALVFAIFLVKPSPYCLLDEVDAPLDDANVYRFNDLVREMAKRSQIIVVTHNKHTMEVVGRLYGVTMQERGVSTMVSVNLQDNERTLEEQLV